MTITKQICLAIALNAAILTLGISRVHGQQGGTPREGDTPKTRSGKVSSHSSTPPRVAPPRALGGSDRRSQQRADRLQPKRWLCQPHNDR